MATKGKQKEKSPASGEGKPQTLNYTIEHDGTQIPVRLSKTEEYTRIAATLPSGTDVKVEFRFGKTEIERRAKVLGLRNVRMRQGKPLPIYLGKGNPPGDRKSSEVLKVPIIVPSVTVTLAGNGEKLEARSCCKWEETWRGIVLDPYNKRVGMRQVLKRLLHPGTREKDAHGKVHVKITEEDKRRQATLNKILPNRERDYTALLRVCLAKPLTPERLARREQRRQQRANAAESQATTVTATPDPTYERQAQAAK